MTIYLISDTHFGHERLYGFTGLDGQPVRPMSGAAEGDAVMIDNWTDAVTGNDEIWHLGDVAWNRRSLALLDQLPGTKHLILGNHDTLPIDAYQEYFDSVQASAVIDDMLLTHYPVHESQLERYRLNIHGHIHERVIDDPRYVNVSVEQIKYRPIALNTVSKGLFVNG